LAALFRAQRGTTPSEAWAKSRNATPTAAQTTMLISIAGSVGMPQQMQEQIGVLAPQV
jgi:hypothetical protein